MSSFMKSMQYRLKNSSFNLFTFILKLVSGLIIGLTLALIGQEILGFGDFAFAFVIVLFTGVFLKIAKQWKLLGVLLFDIFCFLVGLLLKMYVVIAPGA